MPFQALEKSEVEGVELRRANNELQLQKRKMSVQLGEAQAHVDRLAAPEVGMPQTPTSNIVCW